ncbi:MAG: DUF2452 domain-containing protein [Bacteroidota bacterium]
MSSTKKPDQVVYDPETKTYDAAFKSYGTDLGAPVITAISNSTWKDQSLYLANQKVRARFSELKTAYQELVDQYEINMRIYNAQFSFEPVVGETYHLYRRKQEEHFLSIIAPEHCHFEHVGSYYLNADKIWEAAL